MDGCLPSPAGYLSTGRRDGNGAAHGPSGIAEGCQTPIPSRAGSSTALFPALLLLHTLGLPGLQGKDITLGLGFHLILIKGSGHHLFA